MQKNFLIRLHTSRAKSRRFNCHRIWRLTWLLTLSKMPGHQQQLGLRQRYCASSHMTARWRGPCRIARALLQSTKNWLSDILASTEMTLKKTKEGEVLNELLGRYSLTDDPKEKSQIKTFLNNCMPYLHIFLTSSQRERFNEMPKSPASINTAAIKHIILKKAMTMQDAFSGNSESSKNMLVRAVFEELVDTTSYYTKHAIFDDMEISKFSTSVPVTEIKEDLACEVQIQCRDILEHIASKSCKLIAWWRYCR